VNASLDPLFLPRTIAVWGASASDPNKLGNTLLRNAAAGNLEVQAVHPTASSIDGIAAAAYPIGLVDLALISLPATAVEQAITSAAQRGAKVAIVLSSGFGEAGADGEAREARIASIAANAGMRLIGPNCMGVVSRLGSDWVNGTYFWSVPLQAGSIGFASQSGAFGGVFFNEIRRRNLGMSRFISLGNSVDVHETDVVNWFADDDQTEVIGLFCETLSGGRTFVDAVRRTVARKPVIVLKSGKAASGARAAAGHTGALAADHLVVQAALRRAGVIEAADTAEFFDLLHAASRPGSAAISGNRLAIITVSGGPSVLAADTVDACGFRLPESDKETQRVLADLVPSFAALKNPFDLTPQCSPDSFGPAIEAIYGSESFDRVVVINCGIDSVPMANAVVAARKRYPKPTTAYLLDVPQMLALFEADGIAVLDRPEAAVRAARVGVQA
jgi:acyl-CoA synthetase (NDP forming)